MKWKAAPDRKPLIIRGARQVGKTWLMKEFGRAQYEKCAYINFDNNERMEVSLVAISISIKSLRYYVNYYLIAGSFHTTWRPV